AIRPAPEENHHGSRRPVHPAHAADARRTAGRSPALAREPAALLRTVRQDDVPQPRATAPAAGLRRSVAVLRTRGPEGLTRRDPHPSAAQRKRARDLRRPLSMQSIHHLVGVAGFEPTTTCPPDKCATRLRYTPDRGAIIARPTAMVAGPPRWRQRRSALEQLQDFLQLHAHLAHDLAAHGRFLLRPFAFQAQARAADGVALLVQQAADLAHHQHVVALVVAAVAAALDRAQAREFGFPVAQHGRLDVAQLADLADGEVALGRDRRQLAVASGVKHHAPLYRFRLVP